jgi:hypothetical protein
MCTSRAPDLTPAPTAEDLASLVLTGPYDDILDWWETRLGCVFWQPATNRRCRAGTTGYLCQTHPRIAHTWWTRTHPSTAGPAPPHHSH